MPLDGVYKARMRPNRGQSELNAGDDGTTSGSLSRHSKERTEQKIVLCPLRPVLSVLVSLGFLVPQPKTDQNGCPIWPVLSILACFDFFSSLVSTLAIIRQE